jgi:hypothetical protein
LANAKPAVLAATALVRGVDVVRLHSKGERFAELFESENARGKQTLGCGGTGGAVSVPIA